MIVVTGTKRSGTSMWMQILVAGGFSHIGEQFSGPWEQSIGDANPRGFYESPFRQGVFYATNPNPTTGQWLHPNQVRNHAVKVFIPGVIRTDFSYIDFVVATLRNWRTYGTSLDTLYAMEDRWLAEKKSDEAVQKAKRRRSQLPPAVEWWFEYHELLRDISIRGYPVNVSSYDHVLREPESLISRVFGWLGSGDVQAAVAAVEPALKRSPAIADESELDREHVEVFDTLYDLVDRQNPLTPAFLQRANQVRVELEEQYGMLSRERQREDDLDQPVQ